MSDQVLASLTLDTVTILIVMTNVVFPRCDGPARQSRSLRFGCQLCWIDISSCCQWL